MFNATLEWEPVNDHHARKKDLTTPPVRLRGGVFLDARFTAPWAVNSYVTAEDCMPILASPAQMIAYHFLNRGQGVCFHRR
jgi:hypothetical protein